MEVKTGSVEVTAAEVVGISAVDDVIFEVPPTVATVELAGVVKVACVTGVRVVAGSRSLVNSGSPRP